MHGALCKGCDSLAGRLESPYGSTVGYGSELRPLDDARAAVGARETGPCTLEPTAGDGAILDELALLGSPTAVELIQEEAEKAQRSSGVKVHVADFFHWFTNSMPGSFDGVAGNPPYIRFGNWEEEYRAAAFDYMENLGLRPTRLTNAWLPFVVASVMAARRGGRVGLVLPAELLQVDYARQVRSFLIDNCSDITVISFSQLVFPGILQEVVLLLAVRGEGPALMRGIEVETAEDLKEVQLDTIAIQAPLHESEKWTKYYLQPQQIELLRRFKKTIDCLDLVISLRLTLE